MTSDPNRSAGSGAVVIPYGLTVPYLLTGYQLHLQSASSVDMELLSTTLIQVERHLGALDGTPESSVAKALTMLQNAKGDVKPAAGDIPTPWPACARSPNLRRQRAPGCNGYWTADR